MSVFWLLRKLKGCLKLTRYLWEEIIVWPYLLISRIYMAGEAIPAGKLLVKRGYRTYFTLNRYILEIASLIKYIAGVSIIFYLLITPCKITRTTF